MKKLLFVSLLLISGCGSTITGNNTTGSTNPIPTATTSAPIDSDRDGFPDSEEINGIPSTDPFDASDNPDSVRDSDGDGLIDNDELAGGTNPFNADSDGDGLLDGEEVSLGTNPNDIDSDFDSINDFNELIIGTSPTNSDSDSDGLSDSLEINEEIRSDPLNPDTDGDGFLDGEEIELGLELLNPNPVGSIIEVYCADFILAHLGSYNGVYSLANSSRYDFEGGFTRGDSIVFSKFVISGFILHSIRLNLDTLQTGSLDWEGSTTGNDVFITDFRDGSLEIALSDGDVWRANSPEVFDWHRGDRIVIIANPITGVEVTQLLNPRTCELVLVLRSSRNN